MPKTADRRSDLRKQDTKSYAAQIKDTIKKVKKRDYDLILCWKRETRPFVFQKLGFRGDAGFSNMIATAEAIRKLLITAGNFNAKHVRIVAVSEAGALEKYQAEHRIVVKKNIDSMQKAVKQAKEINKKPDIVKPSKTNASGSMRIRG